MKIFLILTMLFVSLLPSRGEALVRLKDVVQSGRGTEGTVSLDFTAAYDKSKIGVEYHADHVSLILRNAYTTPHTRRVFRSSSPESSVIRMESSMVPVGRDNSATVKVDVFFRIPIETVKNTSRLEADGNIVKFLYNTVAPDIIPKPKKEEVVAKVEDLKPEAKTKERIIVDDGSEEGGLIAQSQTLIDSDREFRLSSFVFSVLRVVLILLVIVIIFYSAVYVFKRYMTSRSRHDTDKPSSKIEDFPSDEKNISIIESSKLEDGKKLYIIEVEGQRMLIGVSKDNISMIAKLSRSDKISPMMTEEQETEMKSRLKDKLRNL